MVRGWIAVSVARCMDEPRMSGRPGMAHERLQAAWYAALQPTLPSEVVLRQHPTSHRTCIERGRQQHAQACTWVRLS
jgi:hypothetical protein